MPDSVNVDQAALRALLTGPQGPVVRFVTDVVRRGNNLAKIECPVDTGLLRSSHQYAVTVQGTEVVGRFGSNVEYASAVHNGHTRTATVRARGRRATITRTARGNPWLTRAAARAGITVRT